MFIDSATKVLVSKSFKTAGSSFYELLSKQPEESVERFDNHKTIREIIKKYNISEEDYTKITLIRNPWDYVVSAYYWARYNRECPVRYTFDDFVFKDSVFNWKKQLDFWELEIIDDVVQFENFDGDCRKFCDRYGYAYSKPKRYKSGIRPKNSPYQLHYSNTSREHIEMYFYDFIQVYDYKFVEL